MMDLDEIKGILAAEISNCDEEFLVERKRTAEAYYKGELPRPLETKGRSGVVSQTLPTAVSGCSLISSSLSAENQLNSCRCRPWTRLRPI